MFVQYHHPRAPYLYEVVDAYHGTSRGNATSIVDSQEIRVSETKSEWVGRGAYFFQGSIHRARQWARERFGEDAAVVTARIRLGHCIDLLDSRWVPPLRVAEQDVTGSPTTNEHPYNKGKFHGLDCAVTNRLADEWRPDTVRAAFHEEDPVEPKTNSLFADLTHIQIAVREPEASILSMDYDPGIL